MAAEPIEDIIARAIAARQARGLSVEAIIPGRVGAHIRHCVNETDRDEYMERCRARGETVRIVGLD